MKKTRTHYEFWGTLIRLRLAAATGGWVRYLSDRNIDRKEVVK